MLVSCQEMSDAEERLFSSGREAEPLMEKAGLGCANAISSFFPQAGRAVLFCGSGNNGGDALVAGRWLRKRGWQVGTDLSHPKEKMTSLARKKLTEFMETPDGDSAWTGGTADILVDGLLGIGAKGPLRGKIRESADRLNRERMDRRAFCFAVDIPSGLDADSGVPWEGAVMADATLSICAPKKGIAADEAIDHVGRIFEIPLPEISVEEGDDSRRLIFPSNLRQRFPRRDFSSHKGAVGRVSIVAGSRGLTGAAVLAALGASRAGAGLVSVFVPEEIYPIVATKCPAEVMVRPISDFAEIKDHPADVFAIGPGLGHDVAPEIMDLIASDPHPVVVDADALNAIAKSPGFLVGVPSGKRLLTPHPGELIRLFGKSVEGKSRASITRELAEKWKVTLLHKGARTVVATTGERVELNTTGHPGMASGGMGDVLTGICAALIGQGLSLHHAACAGSWLLGRAAELATYQIRFAPQSVSAVSVAEFIPGALFELSGRL